MSDLPSSPAASTPRQRRRDATTAEILAAAWELAHLHGLAGISLRDLGDRVGLRAQSLYAYFGSKAALFDALFRQGYEAALLDFEDHLRQSAGATPRVRLATAARSHAAFCTTDPVRYQLLFQRPIPDFAPSEASYAVALRYLDAMRATFADVGVTDPSHVDLGIATITGLVAQQLANEPGGSRWLGLIPAAVDMFCEHVGVPADTPPASRVSGAKGTTQRTTPSTARRST